MNRYSTFIAVILFAALAACSPQSNEPQPKAEPGLTGTDTAQLVLPGIVNTGMYTRDLTMTPDEQELYFSAHIGRFTYAHILYTRFENGSWAQPEVLPATSNPQFKYYEPYVSPDGQQLFYASTEHADPEDTNSDIWVMERDGDWWGEPHRLDTVVNSKNSEYFPSVTRDGTIYFTREDSVTRRNQICRSKWVDGRYQPVEVLPEHVNAGIDRFNALIAPDESFLIIPIYGLDDSYGLTDYYVCFRNEQDQWSEPINLGETINSASGEEYSASLSPDGQTFYFMTAREQKVKQETIRYEDLMDIYLSPENGKPNIYRINADFIEALRAQATYQ